MSSSSNFAALPFAGKAVYVTGAGSGMGRLSARMLAAMGADVVAFLRTPNAAVIKELETARRDPAQKISAYCLDVTDRSQVLGTVTAAIDQCGAPDILINMAGIGGVGEMTDMPFETFDRIMQVNLFGTRHLVEAVLPAMLDRAKQGVRGKIVIVGSMGGFVPVYGYTAYGTSKFAVVGFAKCLRSELKPRGVDVACFCPGEVATPGLDGEREHTHPATKAIKLIGGTMTMEAAVRGLIGSLRTRRFLIVPGVRTRLIHLALRLTPEWAWNAITDLLVRRALRRM